MLVLGCAPLCLAWLMGDISYIADLIAAFQMQITLLTLGLAVVLILTRRWRRGIVLLVLALFSGWPLAVDRVWTLPGVDLDQKPDGRIRVVSLNINPENQWENDALDRVMELDADVIVLIEVSPVLNRDIRRNGRLDTSAYPYWAHRKWVDLETSPCFILSRTPIDLINTAPDPITAQHALHVRIQTTHGAVAVGLLHPLSPRTRRRWMLGNGVTELQSELIKSTTEKTGLPMIIGADLNSAPAQFRSRALRAAGVHQSKPLLRAGGSFPSGRDVPGMLMIQIDDIWSAGGIRPVAWDMIQVRGSDHHAIVVDFELIDPWAVAIHASEHARTSR